MTPCCVPEKRKNAIFSLCSDIVRKEKLVPERGGAVVRKRAFATGVFVLSPSLVQDCINACVKLDRQDFIQQLEAPVMIAEARRAGLTFTADQTRLIKREKRAPLARDLIRAGNQLPVLEVRQRQLGPQGQVRVGRSNENDLVIRDDTVSSRHAVFQRNDRTGTYDIHDLAKNCCFKNGQFCASPTRTSSEVA